MEKPIRVVINNQATLGNKTGIGHYTAELLSHLSQNPEVSVSCFYPAWFTRFRTSTSTGTASTKSTHEPQKPSIKSKIKAQATIKLREVVRRSIRLISRYKLSPRFYDIYHEPNFIPLPSQLPALVTIHDLSPLIYPQWHPVDRIRYFERYFAAQFDKISHFVTISESIRQEMILKLGIPADRIGVTYMGVRDHIHQIADAEIEPVLARLGLQRGYFLHVGTIEPRKNILTLVKAYVNLPTHVRQQAKLVLVGGWGWNTQETQDYIRTVAQEAGVIHLGYANEADLSALYCGARALTFPSHYEGFGIPAIEMLACGGAVLASDAHSIQEVLAGHGANIPALDTDAWTQAMIRAVEAPSWLDTLKQGGIEHAKQFTWENCALQTLAIYKKVLGR